ncbi:hypothetical protein KR026_001740, partial [Drosophila bipectinata]
AESRPRVNITTAAAISRPATTATTVASQPRSTVTAAASSEPEVSQPLTAYLLERITALEIELKKVKALDATSTANCNNQRLLKALKDEARETVKSLLIHPANVRAVMEQLRFRFGRPEQLIRSQLNSVREVQPISEQQLARIVPFATRVSNLTA